MTSEYRFSRPGIVVRDPSFPYQRGKTTLWDYITARGLWIVPQCSATKLEALKLRYAGSWGQEALAVVDLSWSEA